MEKYLAIIEVSQKQAYIFARKDMKDNAKRSGWIREVTEVLPFDEKCGAKSSNLVYSGGGHTILQFDSKDEAVSVLKKLAFEAYRNYEGMELFSKIIPYDPEKSQEKT